MKQSKLLSLVMLRWPGMVLALTLLCALPLAGTAAQSLIDLDTRADDSRVLNMVIHDKARAVSAFKFIDIEGNYLSLENFRGKTVALHFWATWCIPCRDELPTVDALQNQLGGKNFTFVPLSVDRDGADLVRRYYADHGIEHLPVYVDEGMNAAQAMLVNGIPYTIIINREGLEIARILGDRNWTAPDAIALMRRLIE